MHGNPGIPHPILLGLALSFLILGAPVAGAEEPFIAIDPVGDHVIGEVFFINGTTNLPVTENLTMEIVQLHRDHLEYLWIPGGRSSPRYNFGAEIHNIPISSTTSSTLSGTNRWSVNVTETFRNVESDNYSVTVVLIPNSNFSSVPGVTSYFYLIQGKDRMAVQTNSTTPAQTQHNTETPPQMQSDTIAPIVPSPTPSSPLPTVLPVAAIAAIGIWEFIRRKKNG